MIELCALASGSNGNSYYIGNKNSAVLVDAGIPFKRLMERFVQANLSVEKLKAVFISHEHYDHVSGIRVLSKRKFVNGVFSKGTLAATHKYNKPDYSVIFEPEKPFHIGEITVFPFAKKHDAAEPFSFRIDIEDKSVVVLTDVGEVTEEIGEHISKADAVFLESNYDENMLWGGKYPYYLKKRVASEFGHLSNEQAKDAILKYGTDKLKVIFLSHLSAQNNTPELALKSFEEIAKTRKVIVTSRENASEIIRFEE